MGTTSTASNRSIALAGTGRSHARDNDGRGAANSPIDSRTLGFISAGRPPLVRRADETIELVLSRFNRGTRNRALRSDERVAVYKLADGFVISTREIRDTACLVGTYKSGISPEELEADLHYALANN